MTRKQNNRNGKIKMEETKKVSSRNLTYFPESKVDPLVCSERGRQFLPELFISMSWKLSTKYLKNSTVRLFYLRVPGRTVPSILGYLLPGFRDKSQFLT